MPRRKTPASRGPAVPRSIVIEAGYVLAYDESRDGHRLLRNASVLIEGGKIAAVRSGRRLPAPKTARGVRLPGAIVLPGFISGHTHVASATPTRGLIEGGRAYARPLELVDQLSDRDLDALTAHNLAELLLSGCTTQVEMSLSLRQAKSYVRVAGKWGVRGYPGAMIPSIGRLFPVWFRGDDDALFRSEPETLAEIDENLAFARDLAGRPSPLLRPMMAAHAPDTHTPATLRALAAAAREIGTGIQIHLSQIPPETTSVARVWNTSPVRFLAEHGVLDGPVFAAHLVEFDWRKDRTVIDRPGFVYAHCPSANGAGGNTQPYPEALAAGVPAAIGIDTHSNDYLENLKLAVLLGRTRATLGISAAAPDAVPVRAPSVMDAIESATLVPARALGRRDLGRIAEGAAADLVAVDVSDFLVGSGALPPDPLNNLLYANGTAVKYVMTDGRFQVENGKLTVADPGAVRDKGARVVKRLWARLEAEGFFRNP